MQRRLQVYYLAVSSLAHGERLFNSEAKRFRGEVRYGVGNEKPFSPVDSG
jgi:hypothetical protein